MVLSTKLEDTERTLGDSQGRWLCVRAKGPPIEKMKSQYSSQIEFLAMHFLACVKEERGSSRGKITTWGKRPKVTARRYLKGLL